jgi:type VI secretion system secreted protein VgrG
VPNLELSFASGESSLSVRSFSVEQRMSGLFEVAVVATSPDEDLDLDALLGSGAVLRLGSTDAGGTFRAWTGVVAHAEQVEIDSALVATYYLRIVPTLWRTTRRRNNRIFQHKTLPEIATLVLGEWAIDPTLELDAASFPRLEYRVQYAETDFAFVNRVLEEAGVAYLFRDPDPAQPEAQSQLVLCTNAQANDPREGGPLVYVPGKDMAYPPNSIWHVRFADEVRSGRLTLRDYDFRSRPDFQLIAEARSLVAIEDRFELYDYVPGAFVVEPDGGRAARVDERQAEALAARQLGAVRQGKRVVSFRTNALDLAPGTVFGITGHPRRELAEGRKLLVTHQSISGARDGEWTIACHAVLADEPYRPAAVTPRPRIPGLQSALVVGPPGEEIHTDEFGRVRVQFHWDREGKRDQHSSCFVRVSQAWAGRGFGVQALPRVGDEVLVGFFEGDPDQPVVVGGVHNSASRVPLGLPAQKTRTTWRSESTPGGGGWNEITFEDHKGKELFFLQAEKDFERLVKADESVTIGASLSTTVGAEETREIGSDQTIKVGGDRTVDVAGSETISVGESFRLDLGGGAAGISVTSDKRIILTTGEASIVLDGPNIFFDGQAAVQLSAGEVVALAGGEVHVDGGPNVYLNAGSAGAPGPVPLSATKSLASALEIPEAPEEAQLEKLLSSPVEEPGAAPEAVTLPAHIEEQLKTARDKVLHGIEEVEAKVLDKVEMAKAKLKKLGENLVPKVEKARAEINAYVDKLRATVEKIKAEAAARINALKADLQNIEAQAKARIAQAKAIADKIKQDIEHAIASVKERIEEVKGRVRQLIADVKQRIADIKANVKARFDELRKKALEVKNEAQHIVDEVKQAIEHAKEQFKQIVTDVKTGIEHAKKHIHDIIADLKNGNLSLKDRLKAAFGDFKELTSDAKADAGKVSADAHAIVDDAKKEAKQVVDDTKKLVADAKQLPKDAVQDVKDTVSDVKKAAKDTVDEAKATVNDAKDQAKGAVSDVKQAWGDVKDQAKTAASEAKQAWGDAKADAKQVWGDLLGKGDPAKGAADAGSGPTPFAHKGTLPGGLGAPVGSGSQGAPVPFSNAVQGGAPAAPSLGGFNGPVPPAGAGGATPAIGAFGGAAAAAGAGAAAKPTGTIVTRSGAFGADSVARAVNGNGPHGATFLQSPNEGQLMVVPTQAARPIPAHVLRAEVVEHQMSGMPSSDAYAAALKDHGYAVYERPWDSLSGEFLQKAVL